MELPQDMVKLVHKQIINENGRHSKMSKQPSIDKFSNSGSNFQVNSEIISRSQVGKSFIR